jgi:hypothetical protein
VTPREAWNEAGDELRRAGEALRKAEWPMIQAQRDPKWDPNCAAYIERHDAFLAAKALWHKAKAVEIAAYQRVLREVREQGTT